MKMRFTSFGSTAIVRSYWPCAEVPSPNSPAGAPLTFRHDPAMLSSR